VGAALGWGALAASSLVLGALLSLAYRWPPRLVALVLAVGAGALVSAVSFELAQEGVEIGGAGAVGLGLGLGALTYYALDGLVERGRSDPRRRSRSGPSSTGSPSSWCSE
jgi:ZIP family zinc transporter